MVRLTNIIFISAVFVVLFLGSAIPIKRWFMDAETSVSVTERRKLSKFRDIGNSKGGFRQLTVDIENAAKDQIGMRDAIVRAFRRVQVYGFNHETIDGVILGRNGHWYGTGGRNFPVIPCASPNPVDPELQNFFTNGVISFDRWLRSEDKTLSVIIVPIQHSLDPSNLPKPLSKKCASPFKPLLSSVEKLKREGVEVLYDPEWIKETGIENFYDKRAFHWTSEGSFKYSRHGVEAGLFPSAKFKLAPFSPKVRNRVTDVDIGRYLGIGPLEQKYQQSIIKERLTQRKRVQDAVNMKLIPKVISSNYKEQGANISLYAETKSQVNGRGLVLGDSFSEAAFEFWSRQFSSTLLATTNTVKAGPGRFRKLVKDHDADHVILVFVDAKFTPIVGGPTWKTVAKMMGPED